MKSLRFVLPIVLWSFASVGFAQGHADMQKSSAPKSEAQISFDTMKTLAGEWEGPVTLDPPMPQMSDGKPVHISMRVTSRGNGWCTRCRKRERRWMRPSTTIR